MVDSVREENGLEISIAVYRELCLSAYSKRTNLPNGTNIAKSVGQHECTIGKTHHKGNWTRAHKFTSHT